MITRFREGSVEAISKDELDVVLLYYIISNVPDTSIIATVYWQEKQMSGRKSIRLSRRKLKVVLRPFNVFLSEDLRGMRVTGTVLISHPEKFLKGRKLGISFNIGDKIIFRRSEAVDKLLSIAPESKDGGLIVFALGLDSYIVAKVDNDLSIINQRRYQYSKHAVSDYDERDRYKEDLGKDVEWAIAEKKKGGYSIVAGANIVTRKYLSKKYLKWIDLVVEGDFEGDVSGLVQLIRSSAVRELFKDNKYINKLAVYAEAMANLERGEVIYGFDEAAAAVKYGSIKHLLLTTDVVVNNPGVVELVVTALKRRVSVSIVNKGDYAYYFIKRFGGVVALF